jgi:hypothetical protein
MSTVKGWDAERRAGRWWCHLESRIKMLKSPAFWLFLDAISERDGEFCYVGVGSFYINFAQLVIIATLVVVSFLMFMIIICRNDLLIFIVIPLLCFVIILCRLTIFRIINLTSACLRNLNRHDMTGAS